MSSLSAAAVTEPPPPSPQGSGRVSPARHIVQVLGHVRLESLAAGLSGGVVSTMLLHPLDLVKLRFAGR